MLHSSLVQIVRKFEEQKSGLMVFPVFMGVGHCFVSFYVLRPPSHEPVLSRVILQLPHAFFNESFES